jgi:chromosomal replication initiation ATPase DnaA
MSALFDDAGSGAAAGRAPGREVSQIDLLVAHAFSVHPHAIRAPGRGCARAAFARQVAIYLSCTGFGLTLTAAGEQFGRDRTTVAHACRVVEGLRDDPDVDATIGMLERAMGFSSRAPRTLRRSASHS